MHTQEGLTKQLTQSIQIYFDRNKIDEKAIVTIEAVGTGRLLIKLHSAKTLAYEQFKFICNLAHLLMPLGVMYEVVHTTDSPDEEKAGMPDVQTEQIELDPTAYTDDSSSYESWKDWNSEHSSKSPETQTQDKNTRRKRK